MLWRKGNKRAKWLANFANLKNRNTFNWSKLQECEWQCKCSRSSLSFDCSRTDWTRSFIYDGTCVCRGLCVESPRRLVGGDRERAWDRSSTTTPNLVHRPARSRWVRLEDSVRTTSLHLREWPRRATTLDLRERQSARDRDVGHFQAAAATRRNRLQREPDANRTALAIRAISDFRSSVETVASALICSDRRWPVASRHKVKPIAASWQFGNPTAKIKNRI